VAIAEPAIRGGNLLLSVADDLDLNRGSPQIATVFFLRRTLLRFNPCPPPLNQLESSSR
jgi:hypothetical protein